MEKKLLLEVSGMSCEHCVKSIDRALTHKGIINKQIGLQVPQVKLTYDAECLNAGEIIQMINETGIYEVLNSKAD